MQNYHELLKHVLENGETTNDRTGVGTKRVFATQIRFDLNKGFPAVTTKKLAWKAMVGELLWFLEGSTDERRLAEITHGTRDGKVTIWTPNAQAPYWKPKAKFDGDLGPVYGRQWRDFGGVDQITQVIESIKKDPYSRRHIVSAWNAPELDKMALPPCHIMFQFFVSSDRKLSCHMYQRSVDLFLGAPFNYASYALLTHMVAQQCDLGVGELIVSTGDTHIYMNHIEQVREQLTRTPYRLPTLQILRKPNSIFSYTMDDFKLDGYIHHHPLTAPMAV